MNEPRYLLISPDGMLGRAWAEHLDANGRHWHGVVYPEIDFGMRASVDRAVADDISIVINCSAWTDVDGAEQREADAEQINATGVGWLAERCRDVGAKLVHYSTDYVFDGNNTVPYHVDQPLAPISAYGRTKAHGETAIAASGCDCLIVRTSWLYAPWANNFVRTMIRLMGQKDQLRVVDDQRGRPTSAQHLAATTLALLDAGASGVLHVTDGGECTWYGFAREIARLIGAACAVEPCSSEEFERPAKRPAYSVLDIEPAEKIVGAMPPWTDNLAAVVEQIDRDALQTNSK